MPVVFLIMLCFVFYFVISYYINFYFCVYCRGKLEQKFFVDDDDDAGASSIKHIQESFVVNIMILVFIYCTFIVIE